jgi:hypothetical protein
LVSISEFTTMVCHSAGLIPFISSAASQAN